MTAVLIAIAAVGILWGGLALVLARGRKERQQAEGELARVRSLLPSEAKQLALELLRGGHGWQVRAARERPSSVLPAAVADILGEYEEIVRGEFWIGSSALHEAARIPGFIKVGGDVEFCELMVMPTGEEVFSSYGDAEPREAPEVSPSVWHKILEVAEVKVERAALPNKGMQQTRSAPVGNRGPRS